MSIESVAPHEIKEMVRDINNLCNLTQETNQGLLSLFNILRTMYVENENNAMINAASTLVAARFGAGLAELSGTQTAEMVFQFADALKDYKHRNDPE